MRIKNTAIYHRFFFHEDEPSELEVKIVGKRSELERILKVMESECSKTS